MTTGLEKAQQVLREKRERGEKIVIRTPVERAKDNPNSKTLAIAAKCYDCIYDSLGGGNWRDQVNACESIDCPLHPHRPTKAEKK